MAVAILLLLVLIAALAGIAYKIKSAGLKDVEDEV